MKSLEAQVLTKIAVLKNKTLLEILELTEDGNNPKAAVYNNSFFKSRDTLFAIFDSYMTQQNLPDPYHDASAKRNHFRNILRSRLDVQTPSQCRNFFAALARGFAWDYIVARPLGSGPDDLYLAMPTSDCFKPRYMPGWSKLMMLGTLPDNNCMGVVFTMTARITIEEIPLNGEQEIETTYLIWNGDEGLDSSKKTKSKCLGYMVITLLNELLYMGTPCYCQISLMDMQNTEDGIIFESDEQLPGEELGDKIVDVLTDSAYDFTLPHETNPNSSGHILVKCDNNRDNFDLEQCEIEVVIHNAPFVMK